MAPRGAIVEDETASFLLNALWNQYVLYAVLPPDGPKRRILKYSYAERLPSSPTGLSRDVIPAHATPDVFAVVAASRGGRTFSAALTAGTVSVLLWLGVHSGLPTADSTSAVAIITTGAALFTGVAAIEGAHRLVKHMFAASRRWLALVSFVALVASALYALGIPTSSPVDEWRVAAIITTVASARLGWSALRAPPR